MPDIDIPYFTVIRDSREKPKNGWWFPAEGRCAGTVVATLKTGDYSIEGLTDAVTIERKASAVEFAANLFVESDRFRRELERMESFRFAVVACEFPLIELAEYPERSQLGNSIKRRLKIRGPQLMKRLASLQRDYPYVDWVFDRNAYDRAEKFLNRIWAAHCRGEIATTADIAGLATPPSSFPAPSLAGFTGIANSFGGNHD